MTFGRRTSLRSYRSGSGTFSWPVTHLRIFKAGGGDEFSAQDTSSPLWTIPVEYRGSVVLFSCCGVAAYMSTRARRISCAVIVLLVSSP